jgi:hypothetical protein
VRPDVRGLRGAEGSQPANKKDSSTFTFDLKIPARGTTQVTYRVRVKWC